MAAKRPKKPAPKKPAAKRKPRKRKATKDGRVVVDLGTVTTSRKRDPLWWLE